MFSYLTPVPVELSPWQLKFPQEIALTPSNDKPSKYLEMFTMSDNAHISTSGQRTCLWWDEMEWKLFLTIIMTSREFVHLDAHPTKYWSGQYIVESRLSPIKIFNLLQIELHFSSLTLLLTVAKYLDFFSRRDSPQSFVIMLNGAFCICTVFSTGLDF